MKQKASYSITLKDVQRNEKDETKKDEPERGTWNNEKEFILCCVGWTVGFGNVLNFPFLAYGNGGGAFLFPYFILSLVVGIPMYFLELAIGQFCSLGPVEMWKCFPLAKGVGVAMITVSLLVSIYYNVLIAYSIFFLRYSLESVLPWSGCFTSWGADPEVCYARKNQTLCSGEMDRNESVANAHWLRKTNCSNSTETAAEHFWKRYVLGISSGIEDIGAVKWDLAVCFVIGWCVVYLSLVKGIKSAGKAVYFTATIPYMCLVALFIYGLTLKGATVGLEYLFVPDWEKMLDVGVWMAAASQIFYSLGLSWGGLIMCGSYNPFQNKVRRCALIVSVLDFTTSVMAGVVIFSVLGQAAKENGLEMEELILQEEDLAFVAYPEALSSLWVPQLWSFLFFFMCILLGLDSQFIRLETCATYLYDAIPETRRHKPLVSLGLCIICCIAGLPCVMQGGIYVLQIMNHYGGNFTLLFIAIFELTAIMWGYGIRRVCSDFEMMLGFKINYYFRASWLVVSPLLLSLIFIFGMLNHKSPMYHGKEYPEWAIGVGWLLAMISMLQIPLWAILMLIKYRNNMHNLIFPTSDWGPADPVARKRWEQINSLEKERKAIILHESNSPGSNINESEV